jgi:hypothetical protein
MTQFMPNGTFSITSCINSNNYFIVNGIFDGSGTVNSNGTLWTCSDFKNGDILADFLGNRYTVITGLPNDDNNVELKIEGFPNIVDVPKIGDGVLYRGSPNFGFPPDIKNTGAPGLLNTLLAINIDSELSNKITGYSGQGIVNIKPSLNFILNPNDLIPLPNTKLAIENSKLIVKHYGPYIINLSVKPNTNNGSYRKLKIENNNKTVTSINNDFDFVSGDKAISVQFIDIRHYYDPEIAHELSGNFDDILGSCVWKLTIIFFN